MIVKQKRTIKLVELFSIVLAVYILPVILILTGVISFEYKFHILIAGAVLVFAFLRWKGFALSDVGWPSSGGRQSLYDVIPLTLILVTVALLVYAFGNVTRIPNERWPFFLFYIFISSPAQEFLFRAALHRVFTTVGLQRTAQMILSALLYCFIHAIYHDPWTLVLTFAIGILWFRLYTKTQHLLGVSVSHAVLGVITILLGIVD